MINNQILYDLVVHEEWSKDPVILNQGESYLLQNRGWLIKKFWKVSADSAWYLWNVLTTQLRYKTSFGCPPLPLINLINNSLPWRLSVSDDGCYVAILKDQQIEIRTNTESFSHVVEKYQVDVDEFPQWRKLSWSKNNNALAYSNSFGKMEVFDITCGNHISISQQHPSALQSSLQVALCHLEFCEADNQAWEHYLYAVSYVGVLNCYNLRFSDGAYEKKFCFDFGNVYPYGISSIIINAESKLIITAGSCGKELVDDLENPCYASHAGVRLWRFLVDSPYLSLVNDSNSNLTTKSESILKKMLHRGRKHKYIEMQHAIFRMCISPNSKELLTLHIDGRLSLWNIPSMKLKRTWHIGEQPLYGSENSEKVVTSQLFDALWWSDQHFLLASNNGDITVTTTTELENLLGDSAEHFDGWPTVGKVANGHVLVLECEKIVREVGSDSKYQSKEQKHEWDIETEEDGAKAKLKESLKNVLYFLTEAERFRPEIKNPRSITNVFRLVSLKETTPQELFYRKIDLEHFGEALDLAQQFDLNVDLVYQRQWRSKPVSKITINDYLSKIKDRYWVLDECLLCIPEDFDSMEHLLKYGLLGTSWEVFINIDNDETIENGPFVIDKDVSKEDDETEEEHIIPQKLSQKQLRIAKYRWQILQFLDRLSTYEVLLGGSFKARDKFVGKFFKNFRSCNIVHQAVEFARASDVYGLEDLFSYYGKELLPHWLPILSNVPETTNPMDINPLIPDVGDKSDDCEILPWQQKIHRDSDWVEVDDVLKHLIDSSDVNFLGDFIYEERPDLKKYKNLKTKFNLEDWFVKRLFEIDEHSAQVDNCSRFVELGISRGFNSLKKYVSDINLLKVLSYKINIAKPVNLKNFCEFDELSKVKLLMSKSSDESFIKDYLSFVKPYLGEIENKSVKQKELLVNKFLVDLAKTDLSCCVQWFVSTVQNDNPDLENLINNAYSCVLETKRDDQLIMACKIFECAAEVQLKKASNISTAAQSKFNELEQLLSAAKIFDYHSFPQTISSIKESRPLKDVSQKTIETVIKQNLSKPLKSLKMLLQNMITLISDVFLCVDQKDLHKMFAKLLLNSGEKDKIKITEEILSVSSKDRGYQKLDRILSCTKYLLDYKTSTKLIVDAASEYFNASLSFKDQSMELARLCLSLNLDKPKPIQDELDLIEAVKMLSTFDVSLVPLQVRLMASKLDIIDSCLQANQSNYKKIAKLLELGNYLHICGEDKHEQVGQIKTKAAEMAYRYEDYKFCSRLCNELMDENYVNSWNIFRLLGEEAQFADTELRLKLLNHAMAYCPVVHVETILNSKLSLEMEKICDSVGSQNPSLKNSEGDEIMDEDEKEEKKSIIRKTTQRTKEFLFSVKDSHLISGAMQWMSLQSSATVDDTDSLEISSFIHHEYYMPKKMSSLFSEERSPIQSLIIRMQKLSERISANGHNEQSKNAIAYLTSFYYGRDSLLCLAHAMDDDYNMEMTFKEKSKTIFYFLFTAYFYALTISAESSTDKQNNMSEIYRSTPKEILSEILNKSSCDDDIKQHCSWKHLISTCTKLVDLIQAQTLKNLDSSVDVERFAMDDEYKRETILGLIMCTEEKFIEVSVDLADKYDIPHWEVMLNFAEYLFTDSGLKAKDVRDQLNKWNVEAALKATTDAETKSIIFNHLKTRVYPILNGCDHSMLLLFYIFTMNTTSSTNVLKGSITLDFHIKLLKKLKAAAPGLNYKELVHGNSSLDAIKESVMESNVHLLAKLATKIPRLDGTTLSPSEIFLTFCRKTFWEVKQSPQSVDWLEHFNCKFKKVLPRLDVKHVIEFFHYVVFNETFVENLSIDVRVKLTKSFIGYIESLINNQANNADDSVDDSLKQAGSCLRNSLSHLTSLKSLEYVSLKSSSEESWRTFAHAYDMTCGNEEKILELYNNSLIQLLPIKLISISQRIHKKNFINLSKLFQDNFKNVLESEATTDNLNKFEGFLRLVSDYNNKDGENDVSLKDILHVVEPFCCDPAVGIDLKSAILQMLQKYFQLTKDQILLLSFFQSESVIRDKWDVKISQNDVESNKSRHQLYDDLLQRTSSLSQLQGLRQLIMSWPLISLPDESVSGETCWNDLLRTIIQLKCYHELVPSLLLSKKQLTFSTKTLKSLLDELMVETQYLVTMKMAFVSNDADVVNFVLNHHDAIEQCIFDEELLSFVLESDCLSLLANSDLFCKFIEYVRKECNKDIMNHQVVDKLKENSLVAEAGCLFLSENLENPMFRTLSNALSVMKNSNILDFLRQ